MKFDKKSVIDRINREACPVFLLNSLIVDGFKNGKVRTASHGNHFLIECPKLVRKIRKLIKRAMVAEPFDLQGSDIYGGCWNVETKMFDIFWFPYDRTNDIDPYVYITAKL